jgi:diacylglycerol kinase family enzyme
MAEIRSERARLAYQCAHVVCNESAGSVAEGDTARVVEILKECGVRDVRAMPAAWQETDLRDASADDLVVVLGGDGTARAIAAAARRYNDPMLVLLPGGTLNMLPRALYGERDWPTALRAVLDRGIVRRLPGGVANGEAFFVAAVFGAPTLAARVREAVRHGRMARAIQQARLFLLRAFSRSLRARADEGAWRRLKALGVVAPRVAATAPATDLEWVRFNGAGMEDLLRLGLEAAAGDWRAAASIETEPCSAGDIVSTGPIPAILDGEPKMFHGRIRVERMQKGPRVLMLPEDEI